MLLEEFCIISIELRQLWDGSAAEMNAWSEDRSSDLLWSATLGMFCSVLGNFLCDPFHASSC